MTKREFSNLDMPRLLRFLDKCDQYFPALCDEIRDQVPGKFLADHEPEDSKDCPL